MNKKKQKNFVNLELGDIVPGTVRSSLTCSPGEGKRQVAGAVGGEPLTAGAYARFGVMLSHG